MSVVPSILREQPFELPIGTIPGISTLSECPGSSYESRLELITAIGGYDVIANRAFKQSAFQSSLLLLFEGFGQLLLEIDGGQFHPVGSVIEVYRIPET